LLINKLLRIGALHRPARLVAKPPSNVGGIGAHVKPGPARLVHCFKSEAVRLRIQPGTVPG